MAVYMLFEGMKGDATYTGLESLLQAAALLGGIQALITGGANSGAMNWIGVNSVSFDAKRSFSTGIGSARNRESSQPKLNELTVTKLLDTSSPLLFQQAVAGNTGKGALITFVATGHQQPYLTLVMQNVLVGQYALKADGARPIETLRLNFTAINYCYSSIELDGGIGMPSIVGYKLDRGTVTAF